MSGAAIVLWILGGIFVLGGGSCVLCFAIGAGAAANGGGNGRGRPSSGGVGSPAAASPTETAMVVPLGSLLSAYKGNEIAGDNAYKDKLVQITGGFVGDVKKDILDDPYVTVGTGAAFEFPMVQCMLSKDQTGKAASLTKGSRITVRGRVSGLMMNVLVKECEIL